MAHEIYNEKFLSYRIPAWHRLGLVVNEELTATEAATRIKIPTITTEPVVTSSGLPTAHKAIIGALNEGREVYSVVGNDYREITHADFIAGWDRNVARHIETIGVLRRGAGIFLSAKLPSFSVKGEEIEAYILAENWLTGNRTTKVRKTPVRVVCMNTLQMSDRASVRELRIRHSRPAIEQLDQNLKDLIQQSEAEYVTLKEAYELLAKCRLDYVAANTILETSYPAMAMPEALLARAANDAQALDRLASIERFNGGQIEHRKNCLSLYEGEGRGALSEAAAGTAWGLYNAVVEYEQYKKDRRDAESIMFGAGKFRVEKAFDAACGFAGVKL